MSGLEGGVHITFFLVDTSQLSVSGRDSRLPRMVEVLLHQLVIAQIRRPVPQRSVLPDRTPRYWTIQILTIEGTLGSLQGITGEKLLRRRLVGELDRPNGRGTRVRLSENTKIKGLNYKGM